MSETLRSVGYVIGAIAVGLLVLGAAAAAVLRWRLVAANRITPTVRTRAPLSWLWSPAMPARLHRRLRGAVRLADAALAGHSSDAPALSAASLRGELAVAAADVDDQLIIAAHHPAVARRRLLRVLESQVVAIEGLAIRVSSMIQPVGGSGATTSVARAAGPGVLDDLAERMDALEAAQAEVAQLNLASGLAPAPPAVATAPLQRRVEGPSAWT